MAFITANEWKDSALQSFKTAIQSALGLDDYQVGVLVDAHPDTAAVNWTFSKAFDGRTQSVSITLYLPAMRPGSKLTQADADALAGYWVHEVIHPAYTDRDAWDYAVSKGSAFTRITNGLEDVRGEALGMASQNIANNMRQVLTAVIHRVDGGQPITPRVANDPNNLAWGFAFVGRWYLNNFDLPRAKEWFDCLTPENREIYIDVFEKLSKAKTTWDVTAIVDELFANSKPEPKETPDNPGEKETPTNPGENETGEKENEKGDTENDETETGDNAGDGESGEDETETDESGEDETETDENEKDEKDPSGGTGQDKGKGGDGDPAEITETDLSKTNQKDPDPKDAIDEIADAINERNGGDLGEMERDLLSRADNMFIIDLEVY